jgi:hypothetical protein
MSSPWASTQASASCAAVQPFADAICFYLFNEPQVASEILVLEPWYLPTEIAGFDIFNVTKSAREKTASERTIGHKTNSKSARTACARRMVVADVSDNPMWRAFPARTARPSPHPFPRWASSRRCGADNSGQ